MVDFFVPDHPSMKMLDESKPDNADIRKMPRITDLDASMDFLGDGGSQGHPAKPSQTKHMRFIKE